MCVITLGLGVVGFNLLAFAIGVEIYISYRVPALASSILLVT